MNYLNTETVIDFYNTQYAVIFAKQFDTNSRMITFMPINQSFLNNAEGVTPYYMFAKPDGSIVFNDAQLNSDGSIVVHLTAQMLAANGRGIGELYLVDKVNKRVLTSSRFEVLIDANAVCHTAVESTNEFNALNRLMIEAENIIAECTDAIVKCEDVTNYCQEITDSCITVTNNCTSATDILTQLGETMQTAEYDRISAENDRKEAENTRISNEQIRINSFDEITENINTVIIPNANMAATNANNAAEAALSAASEVTHIDDEIISDEKSWSSSKLNEMFNNITLTLADSDSVEELFSNTLDPNEELFSNTLNP